MGVLISSPYSDVPRHFLEAADMRNDETLSTRNLKGSKCMVWRIKKGEVLQMASWRERERESENLLQLRKSSA